MIWTLNNNWTHITYYDRIISTYMVRHHWVFAVHFVHACSIFTYETNFLYESYSCVCARSKSHDVEREKNRSAQRRTSKHTMREVHTSINKLLEPNENRICVHCSMRHPKKCARPSTWNQVLCCRMWEPHWNVDKSDSFPSNKTL